VPAVISGAGPSVLALCRDADETRRAHVLAPDGWQVVPTSVVGAGASRL
jgi:homoserine kinase